MNPIALLSSRLLLDNILLAGVDVDQDSVLQGDV